MSEGSVHCSLTEGMSSPRSMHVVSKPGIGNLLALFEFAQWPVNGNTKRGGERGAFEAQGGCFRRFRSRPAQKLPGLKTAEAPWKLTKKTSRRTNNNLFPIRLIRGGNKRRKSGVRSTKYKMPKVSVGRELRMKTPYSVLRTLYCKSRQWEWRLLACGRKPRYRRLFSNYRMLRPQGKCAD